MRPRRLLRGSADSWEASGLLVLGGAVVVAGLAFVPIVGYVELVAVPAIGMRLRHRAGKRYAGLRTLARD